MLLPTNFNHNWRATKDTFIPFAINIQFTGWCTKFYPVDGNTNNQYLNNNKPNIFNLEGGEERKGGRRINSFEHSVKAWLEIMVNPYKPETRVFSLPIHQRLWAYFNSGVTV
jgi:hypothetical protein